MALLQLQEEDLYHMLHITSPTHRQQVFQALEALRAAEEIESFEATASGVDKTVTSEKKKNTTVGIDKDCHDDAIGDSKALHNIKLVCKLKEVFDRLSSNAVRHANE